MATISAEIAMVVVDRASERHVNYGECLVGSSLTFTLRYLPVFATILLECIKFSQSCRYSLVILSMFKDYQAVA